LQIGLQKSRQTLFSHLINNIEYLHILKNNWYEIVIQDNIIHLILFRFKCSSNLSGFSQ